MMMNQSSSMANLLQANKRNQNLDLGNSDGNYNLEEMKDFFMKHYNGSDSQEYNEKLKFLNIKHRDKYVSQ